MKFILYTKDLESPLYNRYHTHKIYAVRKFGYVKLHGFTLVVSYYPSDLYKLYDAPNEPTSSVSLCSESYHCFTKRHMAKKIDTNYLPVTALPSWYFTAVITDTWWKGWASSISTTNRLIRITYANVTTMVATKKNNKQNNTDETQTVNRRLPNIKIVESHDEQRQPNQHYTDSPSHALRKLFDSIHHNGFLGHFVLSILKISIADTLIPTFIASHS